MSDDVVPLPFGPIAIPPELDGFVLAHWNKAYLAYCFAMGHGDPLQQLMVDARRWPHHVMTGFFAWYPTRWAEFIDQFEPHWRGWDNEYLGHYRTLMDKQFTNWLWRRFAAAEPRPASASSEEDHNG